MPIVKNMVAEKSTAETPNVFNDSHNVTENSITNEYGTVNWIDIHKPDMPIVKNMVAEKSTAETPNVFNDSHNVTENSTTNEYGTVNRIDIHKPGVQNGKGEVAQKSAAEKRTDNTAASFVPTLQRAADRLNTVNRLLERIADRQGAFSAAGSKNRDSERNLINAPSAVGTAYGAYDDASYNFIFNEAVNAYTLADRASDNNILAQNLTLLPMLRYDNMILPKSTKSVPAYAGRAADRMHLLPMRNVITKHRTINVINNRLLKGDHSAASNIGGEERSAAAAESQMPAAEHQTVTLRYRDNAAASAANDRSIYTPQQPSQAELEKQFGNLIEGADAGLTPSFNVGTRDISEAMAAIEQTAEKVQLNSKLIEEIREKQRTIEAVTLKSSDMDAISDEMIRKLRSHLRFDKSRFSQ